MKLENILTVFCKELRETLRDRRALISMFLLPTVIIPVITFGFLAVSMKAVKKARQEVPKIMMIGGENSPKIRQVLTAQSSLQIVPSTADYAERIAQKKLRAAVFIPDDFDEAVRAGKRSAVKIYTYEDEMRSTFAARAIEGTLREYREAILRERIAERGLPPEFTQPFQLSRENVAPPEKVGGNRFGGMVPYLLIILCFTGAMYPAIDLTAGEKERGTMETILSSPVARGELVLGKFLVVFTASIATVISALCSMGLTAWIGASGLMSSLASAGASIPTISLPGVLSVVVLVLPLAVLFSAALMTIALFAKTHKEAQAYVSPLLIVVILPAVAAMLPGVELTTTLSLIPILNIAVVSKELVSGTFPLLPLTLIFLSTCVYAGITLALAVRMFKREDVIFRS